MVYQEQSSRQMVLIESDWRLSPFLPIEPMSARQYSFLQILATGQEQQLPIAPLTYAFALEHRRRFRARLMRFASIIQVDPCIASALEKTPELLPDETVTAIRLGQELGVLPETLAQLIETEVPSADDVQEKWNSVISYVIVLIPTLGTIALGFCFFIIPTFKRMFDEFELRLPTVSILYLKLLDQVVVYIGPCFLALLSFAVLYLFTPLGLTLRRLNRRYLPGAYGSRSRRSVLQLLAVSLHGNASIPKTATLLARFHPVPLVRRRFRMASQRMESGCEAWNSLAEQNLVTDTQSQSLSAMKENELRIWTLLRLAGCRQVAERRRAYTLVSLVQPISILLIAVMVLWTCFMCFAPLVSLITAVSQ